MCTGGNWDLDKGEFHNSVSHIKTKGSGGGIFGNVVPMCIPCHIQYESEVKELRERFRIQAQEMYQEYLTDTII